MKNRGNCGLKQARYETSCRLFAPRCAAVQNSFTNVGTFTRPSALKVSVTKVFEPNPSKPRNSAAKSFGRGGASKSGNSSSFNIGAISRFTAVPDKAKH